MNYDLETELELAIYLHKTQPWIPNFKRALVIPQTRIPCDVLLNDVRVGTQILYEPNDEFWKKHVLQCHEGGPGCNVQCHLDFLTPEGRLSKYEYGVQLTNYSFYPITRDGFQRECVWWKQNYPSLLEYVKREKINLSLSPML